MKSILAIILLTGLSSLGASKEKSNSTGEVQLTWFVAHNQSTNFTKQAEAFAARLKEKSQGKLILKLKFPEEGVGNTKNFEYAEQQVRSNSVQMTQIGTGRLAFTDPEYMVFDLPYLFRTHEHSAQVFDGNIGELLKKKLFEESGRTIRVLGFTYSGGYRVMASNMPLASLKDLEAKKIYYEGPTAKSLVDKKIDFRTRLDTLTAFNFVPVLPQSKAKKYTSEWHFVNSENDVDVVEADYGHFAKLFQKFGPMPEKLKYFWETNHSLFLTAILVNEEFYKSLTPDLQKILSEETQALALSERVDSLRFQQESKQWLIDHGYKVTMPSPSEIQLLKTASRKAYGNFEKKFGPDLIQSIEKLADPKK